MEFAKAAAELEALVETLEREGDERALLALELVDAIHRPALELMAAGEHADPIVRAVLAMYGLAELDDEVLVEEALDEVRPYVESHGGTLELLAVERGTVHVRLGGSCHGCAASALTLRRGVEEVLRARFPGFEDVVAHEPEQPEVAPLLQIENVPGSRRPVFTPVADGSPAAGSLGAREVDGIALLLANVAGEVYAFRNSCPLDGRPLDGGRLADTVIVCPWHNCAYDARSGRRLDDEAAEGLAVVPVAVEGAALRVAVNVA
jgi:Fe-S cluster biogenesis protein NfuA/nitrite reductase/ring-hydroxylating ferredoxin subunit